MTRFILWKVCLLFVVCPVFPIWMEDDNPCGVIVYQHLTLSNKSITMDYTPLLLQLMVTLSRVQYWIDDFVSCFIYELIFCDF